MPAITLRDRVLEQREAVALDPSEDAVSATSAPAAASAAAAAAAVAAAAAGADAGAAWENFHQLHAHGRFFRPKNYLTAEFRQLEAPGLHILDIGAGNGASILPVLSSNASARATCCDISATALRLLRAAAGKCS